MTPPQQPNTGTLARLHLLGPVRLVDMDGQDVTPRGGVRRAILAVLALSQQGTKSRLALQDLIWGDRDPERGASSLRNAISILKRDLSRLCPDLLVSDNQSVRLDISRLWIDVLEYRKPENHAQLRRTHGAVLPDLIEGINLRAAGDEEFEDWMRSERRYWLEQLEPILEQPEQVVTPVSVRAAPELSTVSEHHAPVGIGLAASKVRAKDPNIALFGDMVLDSVASSLRDQHLAEVYDYREGLAPAMNGHTTGGPALMLQLKVFQDDSRLSLTLLVFRTATQRLLWSWPLALRYNPGLAFDDHEIRNFVNMAVDRVSRSLQDILRSEHPGASTPYHALNTMFRLDGESAPRTRMMLEDAFAASGDTVHQALMAYLNTFHVGEHWDEFDQSVREESEALVRYVVDDDPFNSLTLTMAGHAAGYVLHDFTLSHELLSRALRINPTLGIAWDHMALHHLYCSRYDEAEAAAQRANQLGEFSPLRFTYETTLCMLSTLKGDHERAVDLGRRVLSKRPRFGAALRYTAVSLAHLGQIDEAHKYVAKIRDMQPDFSGNWVLHDRLAVTDDNAKNLLLSGFKKAGA